MLEQIIILITVALLSGAIGFYIGRLYMSTEESQQLQDSIIKTTVEARYAHNPTLVKLQDQYRFYNRIFDEWCVLANKDVGKLSEVDRERFLGLTKIRESLENNLFTNTEE